MSSSELSITPYPSEPASPPVDTAGPERPSDAKARLWTPSQRAVVLVPIAASVLFYAAFIVRSAYHYGGRTFFGLFDDAMISMRYAENLAHGHGLVYNAGAPAVEGYTNFLWTLYMSLVHLLPIGEMRTSLIIELTGVMLLIGCGLVAASLVRLLLPGSRIAAALAVTGTVFFYPLVFWTLRGMETGLAALLVSLLVLQTLRLQQSFSTRRLLGIAALAAGAALLRDDLILPAGLIVLYAIVYAGPAHRRSTALVLLGGLGGAVAAHEAFRLAYYGNALPNTYYLKLQGASLPARVTRGAYALASTLVLTVAPPLALAAAGVAGFARRRDSRLLLLAAVTLSTFVYVLYIGGDSWEELRYADRFLTTASPLMFVLGAVGLHRLVQSAGAAYLKRAAAALVVLGVAAACSLLPGGKVLYWLHDGQWSGQVGAVLGRIAVPLVAAAAVIGLLLVARVRARVRYPTVPVCLLVAGVLFLVVLPDLRPYEAWRTYNASDVAGEEYLAELGLALKSVTRPGDSVALAPAGAIPYFSQRFGVDLLGVNDARIAREAPKTERFLPGHTKWDYPYSIGIRHPTIVYALYTDADGTGRRTLERHGYVPAVVGYSPAEEALDHLPQGLGVYVSPSMAHRLEHQHERERASSAPVTLDLLHGSGAP